MDASTSSPVAERTDSRLVPLLLGVLAIVLVLAALHDTTVAMVETWYASNAYNHAFLIIPIVLYLGWRQRGELAATAVAPDLRGLALVAIAALAWLLAQMTGTLVVQEFALIALLQATILSMFGWPVFRVLLFPLFYLFFAVPFGDSLTPWLQRNTANVAVDLLRMAGVPVFNDGNLISIPTGKFDVAEACSGLRFLIASAAMGTLFAGLMYSSWWRRIAFVAISLVVPVIANGARAFGVIYLAYVTNNELATGVDHVVYGWIFFTLVMFVTLAIGNAFREGAVDGTREARNSELARGKPLASVAAVGVVALALVFATRAGAFYLDQPPANLHPEIKAPAEFGEWRLVAGANDPLQPVFAAPDAQLHVAYQRGDARVYLHIGYYAYARRGAQAISSVHELEGPKGWPVAGTGTTAAVIDGSPVAPRFIRSAQGNGGHVIWYWYWVDGRFDADPYLGKLLALKARLLHGEQASAIIAISAEYHDNAAEAQAAIKRFVGDLHGLSAALAASAEGETARKP